jgi:threonine synthase
LALGGASEAKPEERIGIFLATAHPAKFGEIVEPILGHAIETPKPLADALAQPRHVLKINATFDAVRRTLDS